MDLYEESSRAAAPLEDELSSASPVLARNDLHHRSSADPCRRSLSPIPVANPHRRHWNCKIDPDLHLYLILSLSDLLPLYSIYLNLLPFPRFSRSLSISIHLPLYKPIYLSSSLSRSLSQSLCETETKPEPRSPLSLNSSHSVYLSLFPLSLYISLGEFDPLLSHSLGTSLTLLIPLSLSVYHSLNLPLSPSMQDQNRTPTPSHLCNLFVSSPHSSVYPYSRPMNPKPYLHLC